MPRKFERTVYGINHSPYIGILTTSITCCVIILEYVNKSQVNMHIVVCMLHREVGFELKAEVYFSHIVSNCKICVTLIQVLLLDINAAGRLKVL